MESEPARHLKVLRKPHVDFLALFMHWMHQLQAFHKNLGCFF